MLLVGSYPAKIKMNACDRTSVSLRAVRGDRRRTKLVLADSLSKEQVATGGVGAGLWWLFSDNTFIAVLSGKSHLIEEPDDFLGINYRIDTAVLLLGKGPGRFPLALVLATRDSVFCLELVSRGGHGPLSLSLGNAPPCCPCSHSPHSYDEYLDIITFMQVILFIASMTG